MSEPFHQEVVDAVNAAGLAPSLDDRAAVALAASFYKNRDTGQTDGQYGQGWEVLSQVSPPGGYDGIAMRHAASRTLVVVNRGTEGISSISDWLQNIKAGVLHTPGLQMDPAMGLLGDGFDMARAKGVDQILICGHSLGGALADVQGALAKSFIASRGHTCPPVRVVGVASAGFAAAGRRYAADRNLTPDPGAQGYILHYVRGEDLVPTYSGRGIFGVDQKIASAYEARNVQRRGPRPGWEWRRVADPLLQHQRSLYYQFFGESTARHIWFSRNAKTFTARNGATPAWREGLQRPDDW